jgi:hypothetical protein
MSHEDIEKLLEEAAKERAEQRDAKKWEPEAGETLVGVITKTGWYDQSVEYDPSLWVIVKDIENDETVTVWPKTVLMGQLNEIAPALGQIIAIQYMGRIESAAGRMYHDFTMIMVPNSNGKTKQDYPYWAQHGIYRGSGASKPPVARSSEGDEDYF